MIDPIAVGLTREYTLESDKENPTIWIIGSLDSVLASKVIAGVGTLEIVDGKPVYSMGDDIVSNDFEICKYGLKGTRNWILEGKEVKLIFEKEKVAKQDLDVVTLDSLKMIPLYAIHKLAMEIWGSNNVKEEEEKK